MATNNLPHTFTFRCDHKSMLTINLLETFYQKDMNDIVRMGITLLELVRQHLNDGHRLVFVDATDEIVAEVEVSSNQ